MSARERLLDWMEAHYKDSHRLRRLDRTEAAEDILAIEAEAGRTALDALRERVEGLDCHWLDYNSLDEWGCTLPLPPIAAGSPNVQQPHPDHDVSDLVDRGRVLRLIDEARPK